MNIPDAAYTSVSSPALSPATVVRREDKAPSSNARDARVSVDVRESQAGGQGAALESRDRFTASEVSIPGALYDVTRVRRGQRAVNTPEVYTEKTLRGERVSRKMADIPLATGRNLLHIYQKDEKA